MMDDEDAADYYRRFIGRLHEQIRTLTAQVEKLQRELSHFYDELGEPDLDSAVACIRSLLAAEAENAKLREGLAAPRKLHKPYTVGVLAWECVNGDCEHDECPEEDKQVCDECWNLWTQDGRDDECFYDGPVMWPCATAALDRLGDHQ